MSFDANQVLFFFGAGASAPFGIPTMKKFVTDFESFLEKEGTTKENNLFSDVKDYLQETLRREVDLEDVFTVIDGLLHFDMERLGVLSVYAILRQLPRAKPLTIDINTTVCKSLETKFQNFVRQKCLIPKESFSRIAEVYHDFFNRMYYESTSRSYPPFSMKGKYAFVQSWKLFTTNYDTCLEYYWREVVRVPLNSGFRFDPARNTQVLDPSRFYDQSENEMKLFKLHGSVNWEVEEDGSVVEEQSLLGYSFVGRKYIGEMMIYPVQQKELYVNPYISMFVRLNQELRDKRDWVIIGYSFNDPIIREIFLRNSNEEKRIVLIHPNASEVKESKLKSIKSQQFLAIPRKFGEENFRETNYQIVGYFNPKPRHSSESTPIRD